MCQIRQRITSMLSKPTGQILGKKKTLIFYVRILCFLGEIPFRTYSVAIITITN
jgi:hypothetical protein